MWIVQSQTKFGRASSLTSHTGSDTDSSNLLTTDENNQFCCVHAGAGLTANFVLSSSRIYVGQHLPAPGTELHDCTPYA